MSAGQSSRWGVFGGTFDPPHLGHLILAAEARSQLKLERVLFVLTAQPPHKIRQITPVEHRLAMLEAAIDGDEGFALSRAEIDRPGPHYAVETMNMLAEEFPDKELVYLLGGDSLRALPTWRQPHEFLAACAAIGVMRRPGVHCALDDLTEQLPELEDKLEFVDAPLLEIASREIRQRVAEGGHYRYYLPTGVTKIIEERGLYRT